MYQGLMDEDMDGVYINKVEVRAKKFENKLLTLLTVYEKVDSCSQYIRILRLLCPFGIILQPVDLIIVFPHLVQNKNQEKIRK